MSEEHMFFLGHMPYEDKVLRNLCNHPVLIVRRHRQEHGGAVAGDRSSSWSYDEYFYLVAEQFDKSFPITSL